MSKKYKRLSVWGYAGLLAFQGSFYHVEVKSIKIREEEKIGIKLRVSPGCYNGVVIDHQPTGRQTQENLLPSLAYFSSPFYYYQYSSPAPLHSPFPLSISQPIFFFFLGGASKFNRSFRGKMARKIFPRSGQRRNFTRNEEPRLFFAGLRFGLGYLS